MHCCIYRIQCGFVFESALPKVYIEGSAVKRSVIYTRRTIHMARIDTNVNIFNVIRYAITSLLFVPCLEWALQNKVESFRARHVLGGGIVRWGGHRLDLLSPVP